MLCCKVLSAGPCSRMQACLFLLALMLATSVSAQTLGQITGHVSDASGASIPQATINLINADTNGVRTTTSTDAGDYSFPSVPPAVYNVRVEHPGFKAELSNGVTVEVQQSVRLDFTLQVGQLSESVEVSAAADMLQSENSTVGTVIGNKPIEELPLNGRQYLNLVSLAPNTNTLSPPSGQAGSRQGGDRAISVNFCRRSADHV